MASKFVVKMRNVGDFSLLTSIAEAENYTIKIKNREDFCSPAGDFLEIVKYVTRLNNDFYSTCSFNRVMRKCASLSQIGACMLLNTLTQLVCIWPMRRLSCFIESRP